uniref:RNA-directed RNA polymerase n=1 Tax=Zygentoman tombus-related virus TaxID=2822552 RepID=A0A8A6RKN2_9TOMB|nr:RNA-dependent RNA polymerase [Zygentoman tombus-related virus]
MVDTLEVRKSSYVRTAGKLQRPLTKTIVLQYLDFLRVRYRDWGWRPCSTTPHFGPVLPKLHYYYPSGTDTTIASYANRHEPVILPEYQPRLIPGIYRHIRRFLCHPRVWTRDEYCSSHTTSSKRQFYRDVLERMEETGKISSTIKPFTKLEKFNMSKYKAPRCIQARHPSFNIEYGRYLKPLEMLLFHSHREGYHFGKGTVDQVSANINKLRKKYRYFTELDHTSWDAHVTVEMLRVSHKFYQSCYNHDRRLRTLSRKTIRNRCYLRDGGRHTIRGTRMSGDVDTSLGNSILNYAIIRQVLEMLGIQGDVIVNGDDSIIFTNVPIPIQQCERLMKMFNQESKLKPSTQNIHTVEYCRTKLIVTAEGETTLLFDPQRSVDMFGMTYQTSIPYQEYLKNVIICNIAWNRKNPLGAWWKGIFERTIAKFNAEETFSKIVNGEIGCEDEYTTAALKHDLSDGKWNIASGEPTMSVYQAYPNYDSALDCGEEMVRRIRKILDVQIPISTQNPPAHLVATRYVLVNHERKTTLAM